MTERQLRTGVAGPLSAVEFIDWIAFLQLEREDRVEAINRGKIRPIVVVDSMQG